MIEINLVPDVKQELIKAQRIRFTVITSAIFVGVASVGVVVALALYIFGVQALRGVSLDNDIKKKGDDFAKVPDLSKTLTIQNQLAKISNLNNNKNIDSRIFDFLVGVLPQPNNVQISDLSIDSSTKTITINGQSAEGYAAAEVFKKTIEGVKVGYIGINDKPNTKPKQLALASDISLSDTSYGEDSSGVKVLRFTLSFTYVDELFSPLSKNVTMVINENDNVTDSYVGIPKTILVDRATDLTGGQ